MAESIRGKVIRDLIARFSNDLLIGKKIKSGELRKRAVDLEPEWKCPEQFTNTMILMENFTMELLEPVENVGSRVVLQLHGGGYIATMKNAYRSFAALYSELGGNCRVLTIDYRVAPEHPYPAALEDAVYAYRWLLEEKKYQPSQIVVAGDSAGGNLALELALAVKAQGRSQPRALVLMSPWTDMTMQGASYQKCAALDPMLTHDYIDSCRTAYRGANSTLEWEDPSLSPLFADLRGLPPTLIQVGTNEILKSDSINLAKAMTEQEVYAVLEVYPECWHVFQQMPIPHAAQAMESVGRFVQKIL